jgi:hypothetical protein
MTEEPKQEDRVIQENVESRLEYWKIQYDFQKHVTTVGLLAAAGFTALLGGFFKNDCPWAFDAATGLPIATMVIVIIYVAVFLSVVFATIAALAASSLIGSIEDKDSRSADDTNNIDTKADGKKRFGWSSTSALITLATAIGCLAVFIGGDTLLYGLWGFGGCPTG